MRIQAELSLFPSPETSGHFSAESRIILHQGDSYDFLKTIPSNIATLIITSPPYNVGKEYETRTSIQAYLENQKPIIDQLVRILKNEGSICWQVGNFVDDSEVFPLDIFYYHMFKEKQLKLRNRIIWHFGHGLHASKRFSGRYETILWFSKGDNYVFNLDDVRVPAKYQVRHPTKVKIRENLLAILLAKIHQIFGSL